MSIDFAKVLDDAHMMLAEAGTGTGKSMAYLVPVALWGGQTLIATGTKNLQEQLFFKDIPLLNEMLDSPITPVLIKGRSNYLCLRKWNLFISENKLQRGISANDIEKMSAWVRSTRTGDRAEIDFLGSGLSFWGEIASRTETCIGKNCNYQSECFITKLRSEAQTADVIVANHHLYFADRMIRKKNFSPILPEPDALILDEAHLVYETASEYLGHRIHQNDLKDLGDVLLNSEREHRFRLSDESRILLDKTLQTGLIFFSSFGKGEGRFSLPSQYSDENHHQAILLVDRLNRLSDTLKRDQTVPEEVLIEFLDRSRELVTTIQFVDDMEDENTVYWGEYLSEGSSLHATPIDISSEFVPLLAERKIPILLTSATLTVKNNFDYYKFKLGLTDTIDHGYPSPFNFNEQARLFIPPNIPLPMNDNHLPKVAEEIIRILEITHGRAFILTTSYKSMNELNLLLRDHIDYPLLVQGQAPKHRLLEKFREEIDSVLLATSSFWQGVDVPGEALSCVIIIKLPFDHPKDPITEARIEWIRKRNENPFYKFQLPEAVMNLKQGVGRLIRSQSDVGIVSIMDRRIVTKSYGQIFLDSLPELPQIHSHEEMVRFFTLGI